MFGKINKHTAMFKARITEPVKMSEIITKRMEEIGSQLGLNHEFYSLSSIEG